MPIGLIIIIVASKFSPIKPTGLIIMIIDPLITKFFPKKNLNLQPLFQTKKRMSSIQIYLHIKNVISKILRVDLFEVLPYMMYNEKGNS